MTEPISAAQGVPPLDRLRTAEPVPGPGGDRTPADTFANILVMDRELIGRAAAHADQAGWHTIAEHLREAVHHLDAAIALTGEV